MKLTNKGSNALVSSTKTTQPTNEKESMEGDK